MRTIVKRLPFAAAFLFACVLDTVLVGPASAHVKWFCAYDVAGQPDGLGSVLCLDFEMLTGLSLMALMTGALLEGTPVGAAMLRALDSATRLVRENLETIFRAAVAFFFIAIWGAGGILLTPELKTSSTLIGALQLGIAAGMLSRKTMPLVGSRHFRFVRRRHLELRPVPSCRLSGLSRRGGLHRPDRRADQFLRHSSARRAALGGRHHADVGFH